MEQGLAGQRGEAETTRQRLAETERALGVALRQDVAGSLGALRTALVQGTGELNTRLAEEQGRLRLALAEGQEKSGAGIAAQFEATRGVLEAKLREMREGNEGKLAEIQKTVNEQLHQAVEKQMNESFSRVIDQFTAVQKAMGDVQAVTAQIGDIKRLFSNVKTRGGWGEAQVRAMLDDILHAGSYETNWKLREDSEEVVEFALIMPMRGAKTYLPIDAKFPVADYERLVIASEAGDAEAERQARRGLERAIREQAKRITRYISPPATVEFAVMYLPTDGLFAEVARTPGLIDDVGKNCRVLILGPSLLPAMLRTIQLGQFTLTLEQRVDDIRKLLGAARGEMRTMNGLLTKLCKQAGTFSKTIDEALVRTRQIDKKLSTVAVIEGEPAARLLELEAETLGDEEA
ncbi:MAG: DNA recombination protein RmuC [Acidisphaera sp.]|nr:DNA recombination protein RmuC [Acidisphaera sp.]